MKEIALSCFFLFSCIGCSSGFSDDEDPLITMPTTNNPQLIPDLQSMKVQVTKKL